MKGSMEKCRKNSCHIRVYKGKNEKWLSIYHRETIIGEKEAEAHIAEVITDLHRGEYVEPSKKQLI